MKHAPNDPTLTTLPTTPVGGLTAGLDWAKSDHVVCVVDSTTGQVRDQFTLEHSAAGLTVLVRRLATLGCTEIAIERPDGPVVDALLTAALTVVVISPNQVKNLRSRYGSAGNKDDRFDAYVLADTLRTDRARLRPLTPDSCQTLTLRATVRARKDLVNIRVAVANQLRAHLGNAFPAGAVLFAEVDSPISLAFLARFTCQGLADWLSPKRLAHWLSAAGYCGRTSPQDLHARLTAAPRGPADEHGLALSHITLAYLHTLRALREQITALEQQISQQLAAHTDSHIFTSLPRSGTVRAARLLAEIGDSRARFPTPASLACLAGVAPSTRASGKSRHVGFRWACDKQLRDAVCDFAGDSRRANPWAQDLYAQARARGHDHAHGVRILARAWLYIIWHCWQNNTAYDPDQHHALQRVLDHQNKIVSEAA
ncbi:MAG TPA: IS110 family transposase [Dermatophilaceae bacterium]|nr:IS110 family transposase [Dermatophilaceae bacterium]